MSLYATSSEHSSRLALAHQRSLNYGIAQSHPPHYQRLGHSDLADVLEQHQFLCHHAMPVMEHLYTQIANTGSMLVLTSASGLVLHSMGDSDFLPRADQVALVPGVDWSEQVQGTNAIGTALQERQAITVQGAQHFRQSNHILACSCAPIFNPYGQLMGALDVTGEQHRHHPHTLALVRMSVQMLENQMMAAQFAQAIRIHFHARPEFLGTLMEGMAIFDSQGQLLSLNRSAQLQLGLNMDAEMGWDIGMQVQAKAALPLFGHLFQPPFSLVLTGRPQQLMLHSGVLVGCRIHLPPTPVVATVSAAAPPLARAARPQRLSHLQYLDTGDPQLARCIARLRRVLDKDIPVMLQGETGTGKDLLARAWHQDSARSQRAFVAVNCASIPESLIESELFGYEEGAFTGARKKGALGKIAQADGGTLFLDEIGDMPLHLQARLLRVLQERQITPLGAGKEVAVDMAVICATHKDLKALIAQGRFRQDLYYRLNGLVTRLPALRERTDLPAVIGKVLHAVQPPGGACTLAAEVLEMLTHYHWPGNVRQLHNVLRTASVMAANSSTITVDDLPDDFLEDYQAQQRQPPPQQHTALPQPTPKNLADITLQSMAKALRQHQGNVSAAAKALGISRNTFYRKKALLAEAQTPKATAF